ncbi:MAG TPA: hypothetical protein VK995_00190 [Oceanipulchritudo sp.]|nr:hypothetical protein [Oceanipulchritudo sp.]
MLWQREAFLEHLCFGNTSREMVVELFGPLLGTAELWRQQGATEEEIDLSAFAWDRANIVMVPRNIGPLSNLEETIISESESEQVVRDTFGRTTILPKKVATISLPQDFPMESPEEWDRFRHWFRWEDTRIDAEALRTCRAQREAGGIVRFAIWGAYDILRQLMGDENACVGVLEEPEAVRAILADIGDMQEACIEKILREVPMDILFVHEDFAGNNGPLVGPAVVRDLFNPYYSRMWELARSGGARIFDLDSDGFVDPVVDALLDGGINCLHPVQPVGGTDMVSLRKRYGKRLILRGGIDKFALSRGRAAIDSELDYRLDPCLLGGGTMFGLDHRIPREVTIDAYRYYVQQLRKRLHLPPAGEDEPGWCRMA